MRATRFSPLLWVLLGWSGAGLAAERSVADQLEGLDGEVSGVESRLDSLSRDYSQRRGLIGSEEALQRFEDAVYIFLIGEYDRAASSFYTLVESESLNNAALAQDSQWYLAECLFELKNYSTAVDVYDGIIAQGSAHPFFVDAVRRELEVYGILRDNERFYEVYRTWILSNKVLEDDQVKYTVAKSFYRQGESVRAKSKFGEIPADSAFYGRARYFLGTVLAAEGAHQQAIAEFQRVASLEGSEDPQLMELTWLALGRLYYEVGDYVSATEHYQRINGESPYFADQLYELVWTYIKQEEWSQAIRNVEIFLVAYPEHRYSMQLQLNQGHLQMKEQEFERALGSYETVVDAYAPLYDTLEGLEASQEDPQAFFRRIVEEAPFEQGTNSLPKYAVEMLERDSEFSRAVQVQRQINSQEADLAEAQKLVEDITSALASGNESIGTFGRGRASIQRSLADTLQLRSRLVEIELAYLKDNASGGSMSDVQSARAEWEVLKTRSSDVQGEESDRNDRYQVFEDQVREVQGEAFRTQQVAASLTSEAAAVRRALEEKAASMEAADADLVRDELSRVRDELEEVGRDLETLGAAPTRRAIMASIPRAKGSSSGEQRELIVRDYGALRSRLGTARGSVAASDRSEVFGRIDQLWAKMDNLDGRAQSTLDTLGQVEQQELTILKRKLGEETASVFALDSDVASVEAETSGLSTRITRTKFGELQEQVSVTIMEADKGIVDVYWLRKTIVGDEITRLAKERGLKLDELNARFNVIRQKLEE